MSFGGESAAPSNGLHGSELVKKSARAKPCPHPRSSCRFHSAHALRRRFRARLVRPEPWRLLEQPQGLSRAGPRKRSRRDAGRNGGRDDAAESELCRRDVFRLSRTGAELRRHYRFNSPARRPSSRPSRMAETTSRQSGDGFRDPQGRYYRQKGGDRRILAPAPESAETAGARLRPWLQQSIRRRRFPLRPDCPRHGQRRRFRANPVHLAVKGQRPRLWL